jgi:ADP-heptose:LPS heptosyltransferase
VGSLDRAHFRQYGKYAQAEAIELVAPAIRFTRNLIVRRRATSTEAWREIGLVGADHIGDVLYRTSSLDALRAGFPDARIHFIASHPAAELLETHPALNSVIVADRASENRSFMERVRLLRSRPFDAVICYDTGDYWRDELAAAVAGISNCAGYVHKGFSGLVTHPLPFEFPRSYSDSFRRSVESLARCPTDDLRPVVYLTSKDEEAGARMAAICRGSGPLLAVGLTGNQPQGDPLKGRMMETLSALADEMGLSLVFLGAEGDRVEIEASMKKWRLEGHVLCGDLRLRECVAFLKHADGAFVVDSGLRHMANAAGIPVVYFRNLYTFKGETGSYLQTESDLAPDVECLSRARLAACPPLFEVAQGKSALRAILC